ncbi:MAG TPA: efflux RND transporter periplasmic adaptor subunit [Kofleriaceae bacterium]|nr:efflux RND transporter periplasmic adaptor subunit [Kofleriaceae bacterium]
MLPAASEAAPEIPDFPGVVTSRNTKVVAAEFQGRVDRINIFAGQKVHAGDPIAKLDDTELRSQIEAARANESAARADAGAAGAQAYAAQLQYKRDARLGRKGYVAKSAVDNSRAQTQSLGAQSAANASRADSFKAERLRLEGLVEKAQAVAPFDGVVMMVKVKEGEVAQRGTPIARVFDPRDLIMKFAVPKEHRHLVALGKRVELRIDGVPRPVWATIERIADEEPPINFAVVEADIDDSKLGPDEIRLTAQGRVRIADASAGGKR